MEKKKNKLWKIVLIIIIVFFLTNTLRKIVILNNLQGKFLEHEKYSNIYSKIDSEKSTVESFTKDSSNKTIIKYKDKPMTVVQIKRKNEGMNYTFFENTKKVTITNQADGIALQVSKIVDFVSTNSLIEKIYKSMVSKIYTEKIDNKVYYVIESNMNNNYLMLQNVVSIKAYIDKETGLVVKLVEITKENNKKQEHIVNYEHNFNIVDDSVFNGQDTTGYELNE